MTRDTGRHTGMTGHATTEVQREASPRRRRLSAARVIAGTALMAAPLVASGLAFASPASAAGGFAVANGFASYQAGNGKAAVPVQFDVLTLASGGTAAASTLSVTGQPSSGTATANTSNGIVTYDPTSSTTGTQTVTFQLCESGPTDCQSATLTVGQATVTNNAFIVPELGGYASYPTAYGALAPSSAVTGTNFTVDFAPASLLVPPTLSLSGFSATINYLSGLTWILPVPANSTYVSGSAQVVGGDAATTGQVTVTLCTSLTSPPAGCVATDPSSTFPTATTAPYIQVQLNSAVHVAGNSDITPPTVVAQFTASGGVGATIKPTVTEFDAGANVTIGTDTITGTLSTYPVASTFTSATSAPAYVAYPLSTTTIVTPPPAPTVTAVSPASGPSGGGTAVTITGTNLGSATAVEFGSTPGSITGDSATTLTARSPAGSGTVNVTVTTPGGTSATSAADEFTYVPGPSITSISPTSGSTGGGTAVTISGSNLSGATAVDFGSSPATITSDSASSITATTPAGSGTVGVTVTTASGTATSPTDYTYVAPPPPPTISGISPTSGSAAGGTSVTITGTNLANATVVDFGTAAATVTSDTATSVVATSPPGLGNVNVTLTTLGGTASAPVQFTYNIPPGFPTVTLVSPATGPSWGGTTVTVTGTNLLNTSGVDFGTQQAFFSDVTATSLTATAPAGSGTVEVTVTTPSGTSVGTVAGEFVYTTPAPTVTALSPTSGPATGGTPVTISGTNFFGATAVHFGSVSAPILSSGTTAITTLSPPGSGAVAVTVTTPGGTSAGVSADTFIYAATPAPTVASVSPAGGPASGGTVVTITGSNLLFLSQVDFGTQPAFFTAVTATTVQAVAPAGSGTVDVTVTTPAGTSATSAADDFAYVSATPVVTAVTPPSGPTTGGTFVTISGTNLGFATTVDFGATAAIVTSDAPTSITALSPAGTGTVNITVTTPAGTSATSAADDFAYGATPTAAPTITAISPSSGTTAGGTKVTITGTNLLYVTAVEFGTKRAFYTDVTATSIVAISPPGAGSAAISVTTPAGTSAAVGADTFKYVAPEPLPRGCGGPAGPGRSLSCPGGTVASPHASVVVWVRILRLP
jgi:hypothetical protein